MNATGGAARLWAGPVFLIAGWMNPAMLSPLSERSSAWLEHLLWEQDVAGSNPVAPTILFGPPNPRASHRCRIWLCRQSLSLSKP